MSVSDPKLTAGPAAGQGFFAALSLALAPAHDAPRPQPKLWPKLRRALFWTHRWLGIAGCLLFVMWFASGLVMMYVGYPSLTSEERLRGLSPLATTTVTASPHTVLSQLPTDVRPLPPRRMVMEMMVDAASPRASAGSESAPAEQPTSEAALRPVWRIVDAKGRPQAFWADNGQRVGRVDAVHAEHIARTFSGGSEAHAQALIDRDQWTVPQGLDPWRPLHRVALLDAAGTELYVSSVTGEVVRDTTRRERLWNWLGAVPHWIYFTPLRADAPLWRSVVIWISGVCIVAAVTGFVLGILRIRLRLRARYRDGRCSPYAGWMRWHHIGGLLGGMFLMAWIISGWLSMDPNRWFQRAASDEAAVRRWQGLTQREAPRYASSASSAPSARSATSAASAASAASATSATSATSAESPASPASSPSAQAGGTWLPSFSERPLLSPPADTRELALYIFNGQGLLEWRQSDGGRRVVDAASGAPVQLSRSDILAAARRFHPGPEPLALDLLTKEDAYWYGHHGRRTLPVWRVQWADAAGTWLHADPATGQIVGTSDRTSRLRRWLFNAPHSLDFPWLIQQRPAWDLVMWTLSGLGLVISLSGVVVGWRRLRRNGSR